MIYIDTFGRNTRYWFWDVSFFSDWSNKPSDYATNAVVHNYYNENKAKWYRVSKFDKFVKLDNYSLPLELAERLAKGDTLVIGLDNYAYMGISAPLIPPTIIEGNLGALSQSNVIRYKLYVKDSRLLWHKIKED